LVDRRTLRSADASDRIAQHLARQVTRALDAVPDRDRVVVGIQVARRLIEELAARVPDVDPADEAPVENEGEKPMAVTRKLQSPLPGDLFAATVA